MKGPQVLAALTMTGAAFTGALVVTAPAAQAATPHCVQTGEWRVVSHSRYTMQRHHREFGGYVGRVTQRPQGTYNSAFQNRSYRKCGTTRRYHVAYVKYYFDDGSNSTWPSSPWRAYRPNDDLTHPDS